MQADLIAIDLDGTLLTGERTPHFRHIEAIARARAAGMTVVLASGRIRPSMRPFAEPLGVETPMICSNGGHVLGPDGEEVSVDLLDKSVFDMVCEYARETGVHVSVYTRDQLLYLRETEWGFAYARRVRSTIPTVVTIEEARATEMLKVLFIDQPDRIQQHLAYMAPRIDPTKCRLTESEPEYLEFLPPSVSKGRALARLADAMGIPQTRVAAIGDYLNDLEMITYAGHSAAMGNAAPAVKAAAGRVVGTNEEGGVADFIDALLED